MSFVRASKHCRAQSPGRVRPAVLASVLLALSACGTGPFVTEEPIEPELVAPLSDYLRDLDRATVAGDSARASMLVAAALAHYPNSVDLRLKVAELYQQAGQRSRARSELESIVAGHSDNVQALVRLGKLYVLDEQYQAAWPVLNRARGLDDARVRMNSQFSGVDADSPVELYNLLGILSDFSGDHDAAGEHYLIALKISHSPMLYANLGYSRYLAGNLGGAEWAYRQALQLDPDYQPARRNYALLHGRKGRYHRAEELLNKDGDSTQAWTDLAAVANAHGHFKQKMHYEEKAREADPPDDALLSMSGPKSAVTAAGATAEEANGAKYAIVRARALNVREAGSIDAPVIRWLSKGTKVKVIEAGSPWTRIELPESVANGISQGWVSAYYLSTPVM